MILQVHVCMCVHCAAFELHYIYGYRYYMFICWVFGEPAVKKNADIYFFSFRIAHIFMCLRSWKFMWCKKRTPVATAIEWPFTNRKSNEIPAFGLFICFWFEFVSSFFFVASWFSIWHWLCHIAFAINLTFRSQFSLFVRV